MAGPSLHNTHCSSHTRCILSWTTGGTQAGSEGQGKSEGEWRMGGMEGVRGGRERGSDDVRQGGSGSGGREGWGGRDG